jgi:osmotically inducible lipoprotein OsmB
MRSTLKTGLLTLTLAAISFAFMPVSAKAGTLEGAAIGAGSGLVIAGPPGAVVGGVIGAVVGGPDIARSHRHRNCWHDREGYRVCARR